MKLNDPLVVTLMQQHPCIGQVLSQKMGPLVVKPLGRENTDEFTIEVKVATGEVMYMVADNIGLGEDDSWLLLIEKDKEPRVARRAEYLFAVNADGHVINRLDWPRDRQERQRIGKTYGLEVLWKTKYSGGSYSDPLWKETKALVSVRISAWHLDTGNTDVPFGRFGEFLYRDVYVVVHTMPKGGFEKLQRESNPREHLLLKNETFIQGYSENDHDILAINGRLEELARTFQDEVYHAGMKDMLDAWNSGASGTFDNVEVLAAEMCGYIRIMLEDEHSFISLQLRPGAHDWYVHVMRGTLPQLRHLIKVVTKMWNEQPDRRTNFKPNKDVRVM